MKETDAVGNTVEKQMRLREMANNGRSEYAKQVAINFATWISNHRLDYQTATDGRWIGVDMQYKTSEELYNQYLQECATSSKS